MIKYAATDDLHKIAKCHIAAFPKSVTSMLGEKVVASMLKWYLSATNKFLFYVEENNLVQGYCGGFIMDGSDAYGSGSGMTQFGFNQAAGSFARKPWLLLHPAVRKKYQFILKNIMRKVGLLKEQPMAVASPKPKNEPLTAGLVVIGVIPNLQQKGLGTLLQQEFERKAIKMSAKRLSLSVRKQNEKAIKSYTKNGYLISDENETSFIMTKDLI